MDKKLIKAILDVIKDVSDRPGLYGAQIDKRYIYFTDGYVIVRLTMGEYDGLRPFPMADHVWVSGEQLKEKYKEMGARDVCLSIKNEHGEHPNWEECWKQWSDTVATNSQASIRPETFKKLAPFGDMIMTITENKLGQKLIAFTGKGVNAFVCPLKEG